MSCPTCDHTMQMIGEGAGFRKLVMRAEGQGVRLRPAGTRTWTPLISWKSVYILGIRIRHQEKIAERKTAKAERKRR